MMLKWDQLGEKTFETGVDHGVLYPQKNGAYPKGVAWNGLTNVTETPSGGEDNSYYADNIKYFSIKGAEELGLTITCYTYPNEWGPCDGIVEGVAGVSLSGQNRQSFGLSYRTKIGSDTEGTNAGFKLHLVYGCSASPSERSYDTINESPEPIEFSYEVSTTPIPLSGKDADGNEFLPTALITIDSRTVDKEKLDSFMEIIYGSDTEDTDARLPLPDDVMTHFSAA